MMFQKLWDSKNRTNSPLAEDQIQLSSLPTGFPDNPRADSTAQWRQTTWQTKEYPDILGRAALRRTAAWIRDDLDPIIAQEGPKSLLQEHVVSIHTLLIAIQQHEIPLCTITVSRIHLAISDICGKATRWPSKLVIEADRAVAHLESSFGPLRKIRLPLFEPGGRLAGVCLPGDITKKAVIARFKEYNPKLVDSSRAYVFGQLDFRPGQWWLSTLFAFRDGIIDENCIDGGICFDRQGAYAIVMKGSDEHDGLSPEIFNYRAPSTDRGRFRLLAANFLSRYPIRILRTHALVSMHAPRAGVRYDGLYQVVGWKLCPHDTLKSKHQNGVFDIRFERVDRDPVAHMLRYPLAEDVDDYRTYKLMVREAREFQRRRELVSHRDSSCELYDVRGKSSRIVDTELSQQLIHELTQARVKVVELDMEKASKETVDLEAAELGRLASDKTPSESVRAKKAISV